MSNQQSQTVDESYNGNINNIDDEDIELSVILSEKYKKEKRKAFQNDSKDVNSGESILFNCDPYQKITGIETGCNFDSISEIEGSISDVNKIRFELDNTDYTQWYEWHPDNKNHQLTCLIDYYGDGDITNLLNTDVLTVKIHDKRFHISYPIPYNTYSSHILFENIYEPLYRMSGNNQYATTSLTGPGSPSDEDVSPNINMDNFIRGNTANMLGSLFHYMGIISSIGIVIMSGLTGALAFLICYLLLFTIIGFVFENDYKFHEGLAFGSLNTLRRLSDLNKVDRIDS